MSHNEKQLLSYIQKRLERTISTAARAALATLAADIAAGRHLGTQGRARAGRPTRAVYPGDLPQYE